MDYEVIIVGGGMVGLSQAIALARLGMRVAVLEQADIPAQLQPEFDGRVSAIALGSQHLLANIGAWDAMRAHAEPILDIRVSDGDSPFFAHYHYRDVGDAPFGYIIENRYTRQALYEAARALPAITLREAVTVEALDATPTHIAVTLGDRSIVRGALAIGADGKYSAIRRMCGIDAQSWSYKQTAIVCTIRHETPHRGLAQERFLPAGPFAVLPMCDQRSSLVWVEPEARAGLYMALPKEELEQEITERIGGYLGAVSLDGPRVAYPLSLMHAKRYIAPRVALIGDAAHAIHPIAGQGVNLGFRDIAVLTQLLAERAQLGLDIGAQETLARYERWRRPDNVTMLAVTDGLTRLFSNDLPPMKLMRGLGLWGVQHFPQAKAFFMRHAMGLLTKGPARNLPALMRDAA